MQTQMANWQTMLHNIRRRPILAFASTRCRQGEGPKNIGQHCYTLLIRVEKVFGDCCMYTSLFLLYNSVFAFGLGKHVDIDLTGTKGSVFINITNVEDVPLTRRYS